MTTNNYNAIVDGPNLPANYVVFVGGFYVDSNAIRSVDGEARFYVKSAAEGYTEATIIPDNANVTEYSGVFFRGTDQNNGFYLLNQPSTGNIRLIEVLNGITQVPDLLNVQGTAVSGSARTIRATYTNNQILVYENGVEVGDVTSSYSQTGTLSGLLLGSSLVSVDNLVIPTAPEPTKTVTFSLPVELQGVPNLYWLISEIPLGTSLIHGTNLDTSSDSVTFNLADVDSVSYGENLMLLASDVESVANVADIIGWSTSSVSGEGYQDYEDTVTFESKIAKVELEYMQADSNLQAAIDAITGNYVNTTNLQYITLAGGQVVVPMTNLTTFQTSFYISGPNVDNGRLAEVVDYTVDSLSQITLEESYPAGTILTGIQNENVTEVEIDMPVFDNIPAMRSASLADGVTAMCKRRYSGGPLVSNLFYEIKTTGIGEILNNGNVAILINSTKEKGSRNTVALMAPSSNTSLLSNTVLLEKIRDTVYTEFAAYTPMDYEGIEWQRWLFTNRFNVTNNGAPRMINCSLANLYSSVMLPRVAANNVSETRPTSTVATKTSAEGVAVGTWVGPQVQLTTTDVLYSATVGDTLTYTITGVARLELRALLAGNGGIGKVTITESAVEIPEASYLLPAGHLVNFISTATGNTTMHIPLAKNLNSNLTYTIKIEVDASNPTNNRVYQAGLLGFSNIPFDAVGINGIVLDSTINSTTASMSTESGTTSVYAVAEVTKIDWKYIETNVASIVNFTVYDSEGISVVTDTLDMYGVGSTDKKYPVASDLPLGTYYLHVENGKTKNAASTDYRFYDVGSVFYDQTTGGEVGVDTFDNNDVPYNVQDPNNGSEFMFIGSGNIELAIGVRKPNEAIGDEEFVGGIHGKETTPVPVFSLDGSVINYNSGAAGDVWIGKNLNVAFTTTLKFYVDDTDFCTVNYDLGISQGGYNVKTTKTTLAESIIHNEFSIMLNSPNTAASNQGLSVGGGFEHIAADTNYLLNSYDNAGTFIPPYQDNVVFLNSDYSVMAYYNDTPVLPEIFSNLEYNDGPYWSLLQDRTDRTLKFYTRAFNCDDTEGVTVPIGTTWTHSKVFRVVKGNSKALVGL